jgi:beta-galactosidase GanA
MPGEWTVGMNLRTLAFALVSCVPTVAATSDLPHLQRHGTATQLVVDGQVLLMRAGELGNSSGEPAYLHEFWPKLRGMHLNTVIVPAYWNLIEPNEGAFDFSTIDGVLTDARASGMHVVLLWFASWKNSMSCYAPAWVKRDATRFPRARDSAGKALEIVSPFYSANRDIDAAAFAALMRHLREVDGEKHTVVLIQVENEIGMIPESRDHSEAAEHAFAAPVSAELLQYLAANADTLAEPLRNAWIGGGRKMAGAWTDVFGVGPATDEIFMAWYFARYTDAVASAGKAQYPLPMYVNAALIRPGHSPGQYPSAGPLPQVADVWRAGAPHLDFLSPDIYFQNYAEWLRRYDRNGNPIFVPEAAPIPEASVRALFTLGGMNAMGYSPFAIETVSGRVERLLTESYGIIEQLTPLLVAEQGRGTIVGVMPEGPEQRQPQQVRLGDYQMLVTFEHAPTALTAEGAPGVPTTADSSPSGGIVIATGRDDFVFAGTGITITFQSRAGGETAGIVNVDTGGYANGVWQHVRFLNGDETNQGRHVRIPPGVFGIQRVTLYRYR